jgi:hypothetical protein
VHGGPAYAFGTNTGLLDSTSGPPFGNPGNIFITNPGGLASPDLVKVVEVLFPQSVTSLRFLVADIDSAPGLIIEHVLAEAFDSNGRLLATRSFTAPTTGDLGDGNVILFDFGGVRDIRRLRIANAPLFNPGNRPEIGWGVDDLSFEWQCQEGTVPPTKGWSMKYSTCGSAGLTLSDVALGSRYLAVSMSLPYYGLLSNTGGQLARCELTAQATGSGNQCESSLEPDSVQVAETAEGLVVSAKYVAENLPSLPAGTKLSILQTYFFGQTASACEPTDTLPCQFFRPMVTYEWQPPPGQVLPLLLPTVNTVQRLHFAVDGSQANAAALFKDLLLPRIGARPLRFSVVAPFLGNPQRLEAFAVAVRSGEERRGRRCGQLSSDFPRGRLRSNTTAPSAPEGRARIRSTPARMPRVRPHSLAVGFRVAPSDGLARHIRLYGSASRHRERAPADPGGI